MNLKKFKNNASVNVVVTILSAVLLRGISIILAPIVTRVISPAEYGLMSTYSTWLGIIAIFVGLQLAGSIQNSLIEFDEKERNQYYSSCMIIALISVICIGVPFFVFAAPIGRLLDIKSSLVYMMILQSFGMFCVSFLSAKFTSEKKPLYNFIVTLTVTLISAALSILFLFLFKKDKYVGYLLGNAIPNICLGIIICIWFIVKGKCFLNRRFFKFAMVFCIPLIFHGLSSIILSSSDKLMIKYLLGNESMGIYTIAVSLSSLVSLLWSGINSAIIPYCYSSLKEDNKKEYCDKITNSNILFTVICGGFLMVIPEIIKVLFPVTYLQSVELIGYMVLSAYFISLYTYSGNYEFYHKKTIWIAVGTITAGLINIGLNSLLIPLVGMQGAAIASALSYFILFVGHELIARFVIKNYPYKWYKYLPSFVFMVLFLAISFLCGNMWYIRWTIAFLLAGFLLYRIIKYKRLV